MKIKIIIIILCLMGLSKSLNAQTFPFWDVNNPGSPGVNIGASGGPAPFMVATNGMLYVLSGADLYQWSQSSGWQTIAVFYETNSPGGFGTVNNMTLGGGGSLYVAGDFSSVMVGSASTPLDNVAALNLTTGGWNDLGYGQLTNSIDAITVDAQTNVYICPAIDLPYSACDDFTPAATPIPNVLMELKNNGTNWSSAGNGMAGIGGWFNMGFCEGSSSLLNSADPSEWFILGTDGTNIFMANNFEYGVNTNGTTVYSPCIIGWNGTNWFAMGQNAPVPGLYDPSFPNETFWADSMVVSGTNVFVAGPFSGPEAGCSGTCPGFAGGIGLAQFSTSGLYIPTGALLLETTNPDCSSLPAGLAAPIEFAQLAAANGNVYVTGNFDTIQTNLSSYDSWQPVNPATSITVNGVAQWNGTNWSALGSGLQNNDCPGSGFGIVADAGAVYVEGITEIYFSYAGAMGFTGAGGNPCSAGNYFVRWVTTPELNLIFNGQNHTLSWSWNGTTPYQWQLQKQAVGCAGYWYSFQTFSGSVTNISSIGYTGPFRIQGQDSSGNPVTPWSNVQIFDDTAASTLSFTYTHATHTLSWTWNGPTPTGWVIQELCSEYPVEFCYYDFIFPGTQMSVNVSGWNGIFRLYGMDLCGNQATPYSNQQAFTDH